MAHFLAEHLLAAEPQGGSALSNQQFFRVIYRKYRAWIFIGTTGIAVRYLQGLLEDKHTDPGVVLVDEAGRQAISLVGGHEGGANELSVRVANLLGAQPILTTATESLRPLILGIGCRRDVTLTQIDTAVMNVLNTYKISLEDLRMVATVDVKLQESGLLAWCRQQQLPLQGISLSLLQHRPWVTQSSDWVQETLGVAGVCEPCALLASHAGKLLVPKTAHNGVTVAVVHDPPWPEKA
ncbi:MAG TPA: cobalamin biosynthesis protein CbiG [Deltaproteobacteria bacterium]|nr:cobalamin biosynthesis protein CbiG [Deltaproteobacteria bacterium]